MSDLEPTFIIETMLSEDGASISLRATARFVAPTLKLPLTVESISKLLDAKGYGKFKVNDEQVSEILSALSEAIEQMELLGHNFFVFFDVDEEMVNVIYKRDDGDYGLLQPEFD